MHFISCVFLTNNNDIQLSALIGKQMKRKSSLKLKKKNVREITWKTLYFKLVMYLKVVFLLFSAIVLRSMSLDPFFHIMLAGIMLNWVVFFKAHYWWVNTAKSRESVYVSPNNRLKKLNCTIHLKKTVIYR